MNKQTKKRWIDEALDRLAESASLTREQLEARIANDVEAAPSDSDEHLSFAEALSVESVTPERRLHFEVCDYCKGLVESVNPTAETVDNVCDEIERSRSDSSQPVAVAAFAAPVSDSQEVGHDNSPNDQAATGRRIPVVGTLFAFSIAFIASIFFLVLDSEDSMITGGERLAVEDQVDMLRELQALESKLATLEGKARVDAHFQAASLRTSLAQHSEAAEHVRLGFSEANAIEISRIAADVLSERAASSTDEQLQRLVVLAEYDPSDHDGSSLIQAARLQWQVGRAIEAYETLGKYISTQSHDNSLCKSFDHNLIDEISSKNAVTCE